MNTPRTARGLAAAAISVAVLALAGCGDGGDDAPAMGNTAPAAQTTDTDPTSTATEPTEKAEVSTDSSAALDEFVALQQEQMPAVIESTNGIYTDATAEADYPGTVVFTYTYAEPVDASAATETFETMLDTFQLTLDGQVFPLMESMGITPEQKVTYVYLNPDGSEVWSQTFEPS